MVNMVKQILSILTVAGQASIMVLLLALILKNNSVWRLVSRHALAAVFIISLIAILGSSFYSEVAGYEPCKLCWFQRILMYPQSVLYLVAFLSKKKDVFLYTLPLSIIGVVIASYHYLLQRGVSPLTPCGTVGYSVSCSTNFFMEYGYITIPMQSLTAFVILTLLAVAALVKIKSK